jgi:glycosyltransferase involved in cell wall biosynthesis
VRVHLVEQGGRGGVFQHTVALARLLGSRGLEVRLHTARDPELDATAAGVEVCRCIEWYRERPARRVLIASRYGSMTLPHLLRDISRSDIAHVQGLWNPFFTPLTLGLLALRARRTILSPHNTFTRSGANLHERLLGLNYRFAHGTIVFSEADRATLRRKGIDAIVSPLIQLVPDSPASETWRATWGVGSRPVVLFAGQLRPDKGLDRLIDALRAIPDPPLLAVVGEDKGALGSCMAFAENAGVAVHWSVGFQPLEHFVGAIRAADVVVCPYVRASQSGVLSIAAALGVPTVATAVGGLAEAADEAVGSDDLADLVRAIESALRRPRAPQGLSETSERAWHAHMNAYGLHHAAGVS